MSIESWQTLVLVAVVALKQLNGLKISCAREMLTINVFTERPNHAAN